MKDNEWINVLFSMMDLYFELIVLIEDEIVDRVKSNLSLLINDSKIHQELIEVTKSQF